jgi:hypothetical protein
MRDSKVRKMDNGMEASHFLLATKLKHRLEQLVVVDEKKHTIADKRQTTEHSECSGRDFVPIINEQFCVRIIKQGDRKIQSEQSVDHRRKGA